MPFIQSTSLIYYASFLSFCLMFNVFKCTTHCGKSFFSNLYFNNVTVVFCSLHFFTIFSCWHFLIIYNLVHYFTFVFFSSSMTSLIFLLNALWLNFFFFYCSTSFYFTFFNISFMFLFVGSFSLESSLITKYVIYCFVPTILIVIFYSHCLHSHHFFSLLIFPYK